MNPVMGLPPPGTRVAGGRIVLGPKYAEGGMSVVHVATDLATEKQLAVKLLVERYKGRPEREQRLLDEGRYLEQLGPCPHIVELVQHGRLDELDGWPFVATELMTGSSLSHLILRERNLPLIRICNVAQQLAEAIRFIHLRGIVHRDITTANVFVCGDSFGGDRIKLFDFSHAGRLDGPRVARGTGGRLTGEFDVPGTHGYMSPEQARAEPVTTAMDVFAFGAVLFELVTRSPLFDIRDRDQFIELAKREALDVPKLQAWAYEIPEALAELANACTDLRPEARPSMDQVVEQLAAIRAALGDESEATERVPFERLPFQARAPESDERTAVELAFARPPHLRPPPPVIGSATPMPDTPNEPQPNAAATGAGWRWPVAGAGLLLLALGVGGWVWLDLNSASGEEDLGPSPSSAEPTADSQSTNPAPTKSVGERHFEPVPEVAPEEKLGPAEKAPTAKNAEEKAPREKAETPRHATPECQAIRKEVEEAVSTRKWSVVLEHTNRSASCWAKSSELRRLQVEALAQTKSWAKCIDAGKSSDDPAVVKWVEFCHVRAQR